jgi:hypothetical protein
LRASITPVGVTFRFLAFQMFVKFGIQNALRQRLLQIVKQAVLGKQLLRVTTGQKPVQ